MSNFIFQKFKQETLANKIAEGLYSTWKQDINSKFLKLYDDEDFKDLIAGVIIDAYNRGYNDGRLHS